MSSASHEHGSAVDLCQGIQDGSSVLGSRQSNGYVDSADFRANWRKLSTSTLTPLMPSGRHTTEERRECTLERE
jgi:hypothetical protein